MQRTQQKPRNWVEGRQNVNVNSNALTQKLVYVRPIGCFKIYRQIKENTIKREGVCDNVFYPFTTVETYELRPRSYDVGVAAWEMQGWSL